MKDQGKFIVFEGHEGSGKTTQIEILKSYLNGRGIDAVYTKEPGYVPEIRTLLLNKDVRLEPETELLLFAADRSEHIRKFVQPNIDAGKVVICDRYTASTFAYQVHGRGLNGPDCASINEFAGGGLEPDLWVWLQIKPDEGLARVAEKRQLDRIEENSHEFFQRVNSGYNTFMAPRSNVCEIDATLPEMEIMAKIVYALEKILV